MAISKLNPIEGGIPKGNTAARPANPVVGTVYYNGEIEALEIYNGTSWKVSKTEGFPPDAPTISSVTDSSTSAAYSSTAGTLTIVMVPAATGGTATQYNAYTTVGGHSGFTTVGTTVTITGLTPGTAYTVYGNAQNGSGVSTNTSNASPVTPTTLPQVPTIGTTTLSGGLPVVNWTLGSTGGKNLSAITITPYLNGTTAETSRTAATTSSTSYTFTSGQLTEDASYTFKVKTTNANGESAESSASNSITVNETFSVEYLVVAGGASGGGGGGGGAGGYRSGSFNNFTRGSSYTLTVGAGGASRTTNLKGNAGSNSQFSSITASGGGGGGEYIGTPGDVTGIAGGSGGGGGWENSGSATGDAGGAGNAGSYTPVEGYAGGRSGTNSLVYYTSGGGGGAGAVGGNATSSVSGVGGTGIENSILGTSYYWAGGGGGGSQGAQMAGNGGAGGGGGGACHNGAGTYHGTGGSGLNNGGIGETNTGTTRGGNGGTNTGGGGGGMGISVFTSGSGGSGIVVLKYPTSAISSKSIDVGLSYTEDTTTSAGNTILKFTAGTGTVTLG